MHNVRSKTVFCPGHITGFFQTCDHSNPHQKGSIGCGIALDKGLLTIVDVADVKEKKIGWDAKVDDPDVDIFLNGKKGRGETILSVVSELSKITEKKYGRTFHYTISGKSDFPPGCGFGISAAGALGTAWAVNDALKLDLLERDLMEIAHIAEVQNKSGLGDVAGESLGGLVLREKPGGSFFGDFHSIPIPEKKVFCLVLGELSTKEIISSPKYVQTINAAGKEALTNFKKEMTIESFMRESLNFTNKAGLLSEEAKKIIESVDENMGFAAQAMLGNTVFAMAKDFKNDEKENMKTEAEENILKTFKKFGTVYECKIGNCGPSFVENYRF
ncbi:pantoate kinase [Methanolapillus ohkumae]|uniref:Pantoate kinase n=1 Tax=Methanolapillus ohkumae TaxID=3028298 RepID=A0AA96VE01_9EURY|nr:hypothetical protein MsAm2_03180 [Methanosarcinaceae archaeon Am2]